MILVLRLSQYPLILQHRLIYGLLLFPPQVLLLPPTMQGVGVAVAMEERVEAYLEDLAAEKTLGPVEEGMNLQLYSNLIRPSQRILFPGPRRWSLLWHPASRNQFVE